MVTFALVASGLMWAALASSAWLVGETARASDARTLRTLRTVRGVAWAGVAASALLATACLACAWSVNR